MKICYFFSVLLWLDQIDRHFPRTFCCCSFVFRRFPTVVGGDVWKLKNKPQSRTLRIKQMRNVWSTNSHNHSSINLKPIIKWPELVTVCVLALSLSLSLSVSLSNEVFVRVHHARDDCWWKWTVLHKIVRLVCKTDGHRTILTQSRFVSRVSSTPWWQPKRNAVNILTRLRYVEPTECGITTRYLSSTLDPSKIMISLVIFLQVLIVKFRVVINSSYFLRRRNRMVEVFFAFRLDSL